MAWSYSDELRYVVYSRFCFFILHEPNDGVLLPQQLTCTMLVASFHGRRRAPRLDESFVQGDVGAEHAMYHCLATDAGGSRGGVGGFSVSVRVSAL